MSSIPTTHIEIDERGVAWISGANTKVIEVVLDKLAYGWSPEEILRAGAAYANAGCGHEITSLQDVQSPSF